MFNKIENLFYLTIMLISVFSILSALYIEHILSVPACKLCLYQRIPYIFSTIICFFGYFFPKRKIWIYLLILIFICSLAISGYHVGIENEIFYESVVCTNENFDITNKSKLLESLNNQTPSCKEVNFSIFGLSLATINFMISLLITIIFILIIKNEKNK